MFPSARSSPSPPPWSTASSGRETFPSRLSLLIACVHFPFFTMTQTNLTSFALQAQTANQMFDEPNLADKLSTLSMDKLRELVRVLSIQRSQ